MEEQIVRYLIPATGLISGLIGAYVGLQNRLLLAEVRKEIAELENRLIEKINETYMRRGECALREELVHERLASIAEDLKNKNAAGGSGRRHDEAGESTE